MGNQTSTQGGPILEYLMVKQIQSGITDLDALYRGSGFVVRPRGRRISTVKVRVGECYIFVAESNCVVVRRGEEQLEANNRSAAKRTRFGGM